MDIKISKIIRSRRRTITLQICNDASLVIRAPIKTSNAYIDKLLYEKRFWISKKQEWMLQQQQLIKKKEFVNGEDFLYLGNTYKLFIIDNAKAPLTFENNFLLSQSCLDKAKELFIQWYKEQALQKILERVGFYCSGAGLKYNKVRVTNAQKRWGSCGSNGNLNFNWRLIMAPAEVLDYVVAHEVSHLSEKNHSKRFWAKVETLFPDYKKQRKWLKENKYLLSL